MILMSTNTYTLTVATTWQNNTEEDHFVQEIILKRVFNSNSELEGERMKIFPIAETKA